MIEHWDLVPEGTRIFVLNKTLILHFLEIKLSFFHLIDKA